MSTPTQLATQISLIRTTTYSRCLLRRRRLSPSCPSSGRLFSST
jgi:hypothetical protein